MLLYCESTYKKNVHLIRFFIHFLLIEYTMTSVLIDVSLATDWAKLNKNDPSSTPQSFANTSTRSD